MQKSVLLEIISSLDRKEVRDLNKWLQSPAHNQREDVVLLFDYLLKAVQDGQSNIEKEHAWKVVFPGEPFDDARMRQVMHFLLKALEEYLIYADHARDPVQYHINLARIYRQRKLDKAYRQAHRMGANHLESQPLRNGYYLMHRFHLEEEEYYYRMGISQNAAVNLQETADALENWFSAEKLRISNSMLAHHTVFQKASYDQGLLKQILQYATERNLLKEPAVRAYYYAYMAITHPSEEHYFDQFEDLIHDQCERLFSASEVLNLYRAALNYCAAKVNQGNLDYCRRALQFYRKGLDTGILIENNQITRYTFGNAVAFAIKIGEFNWAQQFVENYQHLLEEKHRESIVNFNLSRLFFEKGDYDQAQRLLTHFEYDDMLLNIIAKSMLLKIYYEIGELDAFESLLESMRIYLQRKEALDPTRKSAYKNMISLMKKLLNLNPYSKTQTERLQGLVLSTQPLMERDWLLRQLEPRK